MKLQPCTKKDDWCFSIQTGVIMNKILVAVDSFKGSMTSLGAGNAIEKGIKSILPDAEIRVRPVADGGAARHGPRNQELDFRAVLRRTGSHAADGLASCASDEGKGPLVHCHDDRRGLPRHHLQAVGELPDGRLRSGYPKAQCRTRGMDSCISRPVPLGPPPLQDST